MGVAWNKAADCLSRLVELPHDRQAIGQMLSTINHDGPAFHTRSRSALSIMIKHLTLHPTTGTTTPDITKITDTWDAIHQNHLPMIDCKHYYRCREQIHFLSASLNAYQTEKHQNMKLVSFYTARDYCANTSQIQTRCSWLLSYQNHGNTQNSWEAHDKLGHQGATHTYCLIKCHYYWKGINKDIRKYIANCTLCHREQANVSILPFANHIDTRMTIW